MTNTPEIIKKINEILILIDKKDTDVIECPSDVKTSDVKPSDEKCPIKEIITEITPELTELQKDTVRKCPFEEILKKGVKCSAEKCPFEEMLNNFPKKETQETKKVVKSSANFSMCNYDFNTFLNLMYSILEYIIECLIYKALFNFVYTYAFINF